MVGRIADDVVQESERHWWLNLAGLSVPANEILREVGSCVWCADHEAVYRPINHMHFARWAKRLQAILHKFIIRGSCIECIRDTFQQTN